MSLGLRLKLLRKQRNLTQSQVANALNFSRSVYSQYECDERTPSLERILSFATFFRVSVDYLCGNSSQYLIDISDLDNEAKALILNILRRYQ